jgi:hypothetical protein
MLEAVTNTTKQKTTEDLTMYYTFRDNRNAKFCAYLPNSKEAEIFANRNALEIIGAALMENY